MALGQIVRMAIAEVRVPKALKSKELMQGGLLAAVVAVALLVLVVLYGRVVMNAVMKVVKRLYVLQDYPVVAATVTGTVIAIVVVSLYQPRWLVTKMMGNTFVQEKIFGSAAIGELADLSDSMLGAPMMRPVRYLLHVVMDAAMFPARQLSRLVACPSLIAMLTVVTLVPAVLAWSAYKIPRISSQSYPFESALRVAALSACAYFVLFVLSLRIPSLSTLFTGPDMSPSTAASIVLAAILAALVTTSFVVAGRSRASDAEQTRFVHIAALVVCCSAAAAVMLFSPWASERGLARRRLRFEG